MKSTRGFTALGALMLTAALTAMLMAGFDARQNDLGREDATLCRLKARLAAESAIAVAQAGFARGSAAAVTRGDGWTLSVSGRTATARGSCAASEVVLEVVFGPKAQVTSWAWR